MDYVIHTYTGLPYSESGNTDIWTLPSWQKSLIVSILSAGTFFGAIIAGDLAGETALLNFLIRKLTVVVQTSLGDVQPSLLAASFSLLASFYRLPLPHTSFLLQGV